ncbi:hypothetical protein FRB96_003438 [Tulasnella sp. 330]|nr:hypothetical protein FRB96_003438 [Tulasnella sp. 330]
MSRPSTHLLRSTSRCNCQISTKFAGYRLSKKLKPPPRLEATRPALALLVSSSMSENKEVKYRGDPASGDARHKVILAVECQALLEETGVEPMNLKCGSDQIRSTSEAKHLQQIGIQLAWLNYQQNATLMIHKLPPEILAIILAESITSYTPGRILNLRSLSRVSQYWRRTVLSTPELWSVISSGMRQGEVELALKMSKAALLDVENLMDRHPLFTQAVRPHSSRWRSIAATQSRAIILCLESEVPALRDLLIDNDVPGWKAESSRPIKLGPGVDLRSLELRDLGIEWDCSRLRGLKHLSIANLEGRHAPSSSQLITILKSSPQLKSLKLSHIEFDEDISRSFHEPRVTLLGLESLWIREITNSVYTRLLKTIKFNGCKRVSLSMGTTHRRGAAILDFDHSSADFIENISTSIGLGQTIRLKITRDTVLLDAGGPGVGQGLYLKLGTRATAATMRESAEGPLQELTLQAAQIIRSTHPNAEVDLQIETDDFLAEDLEAFPQVATLRVVRIDGAKLFRYLGQRCAGGEWPCSNIKLIDLRDNTWSNKDSLRRLIKARWIQRLIKARWIKYGVEDVEEVDGATQARRGLVAVVLPAGTIYCWCPRSITE